MVSSLGIDKPIVMIGMMGTGKSDIGHRLALRLSVPFYDSDAQIVEDQGIPVSEIFDNNGEAYFRKVEQRVVESLMLKGASVISLGGGAIVTPAILDLVKKDAVSVWLNVDPDVIYHRVKGDKSRPLLQGVDIKQKIQDILASRKELYTQADIHIDNTENNPSKTVDKIVKALEEFCAIGGA